jgi:hypothetical protein
MFSYNVLKEAIHGHFVVYITRAAIDQLFMMPFDTRTKINTPLFSFILQLQYYMRTRYMRLFMLMSANMPMVSLPIFKR